MYCHQSLPRSWSDLGVGGKDERSRVEIDLVTIDCKFTNDKRESHHYNSSWMWCIPGSKICLEDAFRWRDACVFRFAIRDDTKRVSAGGKKAHHSDTKCLGTLLGAGATTNAKAATFD